MMNSKYYIIVDGRALDYVSLMDVSTDLESNLMMHPADDGQVIADNMVNMPDVVEADCMAPTHESAKNEIVLLRKARNEHLQVAIISKIGERKDFFINRITVKESTQKYDMLDIKLRLVKAMVANTVEATGGDNSPFSDVGSIGVVDV